MAPKHITFMGPFTLDLTALQNKLVDVEEGGLQGFRTDMPGFQAMSLSLAESMPLHGAAAGIPQEIHDHFVMCNETVDAIDERLAVAAKQLEVLRESRAFYIDARQNDISLMVDAMRSRAQRRKDTSPLVPFEQLIQIWEMGDLETRTTEITSAVGTIPKDLTDREPFARAMPRWLLSPTITSVPCLPRSRRPSAAASAGRPERAGQSRMAA